jgi:hypothetical protein
MKTTPLNTVVRAQKIAGKTVLVLPAPYQEAANVGIVAAAAKRGIELNGVSVFYLDVKAHYNGNKKLASRSQKTYICHYRLLWNYLATIGDYDSMLMFVRPKLGNKVPAMKLDSLLGAMRFKNGVSYEELKIRAGFTCTRARFPCIHV